MRTSSQPSSPALSQTTALRRLACRSVLVATLLVAVGLLSACQLPLAGQPSGAQPPVDPSPAPVVEGNSQPGDSAPVANPEPEPAAQPGEKLQEPSQPPPAEPTSPLPGVPEGERSQFIAHGARSCKMVALTYDAGSGADGAVAILDILKKHDLKVTFFLTGKWAEKYPDLAKRIADEGHEIANHTYSHPDLTTIPDEEVLQQIKDGEAAIRKATGKDPKPLFREPYGAFNDHERALVRQAGYSYSIYWDLDTLDWQFPGVETLTNRLLKAQGGSIVLMHLNVPDSAIASDNVIPVLQERGYEIVTVSRLIQCQGE